MKQWLMGKGTSLQRYLIVLAVLALIVQGAGAQESSAGRSDGAGGSGGSGGSTTAENSADEYRVPTVAAHLGMDFFAWRTPFLVTGVDLHFQLQPALYALLGADFGIHVEDTGGEPDPSFLFPIRGGLLFPFPRGERLSLAVTAGISPVFLLGDTTSFQIGPWAGISARFSIHPVLSLFIDLRQNLLFGGDSWISTGTRISGGFSF